ncbi:MAG: hypothetical protein U0528_04120 [Anaerolineae bacterium]
MTTETPAQRLEKLRYELEWAESVNAAQPHQILSDFRAFAHALTTMLTTPNSVHKIALPAALVSTETPQRILHTSQPLILGQRSLLNIWRGGDAQEQLLKTLLAWSDQTDPAIGQISRFVCYLTAENLLVNIIPDTLEIQSLQAFDLKKRRLIESDGTAVVAALIGHMQTLRLAERLYPGWISSDIYTEKHAALATAITVQGRGLVHEQMTELIADLTAAWQSGKIARSLTLLIPFLNEHQYSLDTYRLVVVPTSRIPFQPAFVVSACRLAEREIRNNPNYAQTTRWQIISELDRLAQAFEQSTQTTLSV